jgi:flavodoxin
MNVAVVYATVTGHSRKIAQAIAQRLSVEAQDYKSKPTLDSVDLLFMVSGIYAGKSSADFLSYVKEIEPAAVHEVVLITSSMGKTTRQVMVREALEAKGVAVASDEYTCQGNFLFFGWGHPKKEEIDGAADFAQKFSAAKPKPATKTNTTKTTEKSK